MTPQLLAVNTHLRGQSSVGELIGSMRTQFKNDHVGYLGTALGIYAKIIYSLVFRHSEEENMCSNNVRYVHYLHVHYEW